MTQTELLVILAGVGIVALLWLALRFGRQIARAVLVVGILVVGVILALALLTQAGATRQATQAVQAASVGQSLTVVVLALALGGMGAVTIGALGMAGLFWIRWRLVERQREQLPRRQKRRALSLHRPVPDGTGSDRTRALPHKDPLSYGQRTEGPPEVVYIVEGEADPVPLDGLDLEVWGW